MCLAATCSRTFLVSLRCTVDAYGRFAMSFVGLHMSWPKAPKATSTSASAIDGNRRNSSGEDDGAVQQMLQLQDATS